MEKKQQNKTPNLSSDYEANICLANSILYEINRFDLLENEDILFR